MVYECWKVLNSVANYLKIDFAAEIQGGSEFVRPSS